RRVADVRHRPHHVLGRLSFRAERGGSQIPRQCRAGASRQGQARARHRGCAVKAQGRGALTGPPSLFGRRTMLKTALAFAFVIIAPIGAGAQKQIEITLHWITDSHGCKVWDSLPSANESVSWSGPCKDGYADGEGTLAW